MSKLLDRSEPLASHRGRPHLHGRQQHCTYYGWSAPPPLVACALCQTGMADLLALSNKGGGQAAVAYRCRACGHEFRRIA